MKVKKNHFLGDIINLFLVVMTITTRSRKKIFIWVFLYCFR